MSLSLLMVHRVVFSIDNAPVTDTPNTEVTIETAIEHAKRAFALKKFEQAIEHYATALEMM